MLLNEDQLELLRGDLDYILARTKCDKLQLTRGQVMNALSRDPDVMLDLVEGMPRSEARWLSVPLDVLDRLVQQRARGGASAGAAGQASLPGV